MSCIYINLFTWKSKDSTSLSKKGNGYCLISLFALGYQVEKKLKNIGIILNTLAIKINAYNIHLVIPTIII